MAFTVEIAGRLKYTVRDKLEGTRKMANIYFRRKRRLLYSLLAAVLLSAFVLAFLVWNGYLLLNNPSRERYPVRGVDVSKYQGEIDWPVLAEQEISFAFIKATEGSSHVDARFAYNYEEARKTGLRVGAYHFFSFDSGGDTQAENFIRNVEAFEGMLPPVIDLEFYGDKAENPPGREEVRGQLDILLARLEDHYGLSPVLYATKASYELYLAGDYKEYDIWIRDVVTHPSLSDGREWTFWQYTNRERLDGYQGEERFIDMNIFHGTEEEFLHYAKTGTAV